MTDFRLSSFGGGGGGGGSEFIHIPSKDPDFSVAIPLKLPQSIDTDNDFACSGVQTLGTNVPNKGVQLLDCNEFDVAAAGAQLLLKPGITVIRCNDFNIASTGDGIMGMNGFYNKYGNGRLYSNNVGFDDNSDSSSSIIVVLCETATITDNVNLSASNQADFETIVDQETENGHSSVSYGTIKRSISDGTYFYTIEQNYLIGYAINQDGSLTYAGEYNFGSSPGNSLYYDSAIDRIFIARGTSQVWCLSFNGTTFSTHGSCNANSSNTNGVWGDGTYIYVASEGSNGGLYAFTHNGTSWSSSIDFEADGSGGFQDVCGDGTYIYVAAANDGVNAYTFNGTSFTTGGNRDDGGTYDAITCGGGNIYCALDSTSVKKYTYNGSSFTLVGSLSGTADEDYVEYDTNLDHVYAWDNDEWRAFDSSGTLVKAVTGISNLRSIYADHPTHLYLVFNDRIDCISKGYNGKGGELHVYAKTSITNTAGTINVSGGTNGYKGKIVLHAPSVNTTGATHTNTGLYGSPFGADDDIVIKTDNPFLS